MNKKLNVRHTFYVDFKFKKENHSKSCDEQEPLLTLNIDVRLIF